MGCHQKGDKQRNCVGYSLCFSRCSLCPSPLCSAPQEVSSTQFIPWAFLLSTFELASVNGKYQEVMETEEREMELFSHYSCICSTEGHNSWQVSLSYNHWSCQGLAIASSTCPFICYWLQKKRLKESKSRFQEIRWGIFCAQEGDGDDLVQGVQCREVDRFWKYWGENLYAKHGHRVDLRVMEKTPRGSLRTLMNNGPFAVVRALGFNNLSGRNSLW